MASLRPHTAAKLLRTSLPSRQGLALAQQRRFKTDNSKTALTEHGEVHPATKPINAPDYGVHIDKATSTYTPVPKRVMDGSEEGEVLPAAVLSGAPIELQARTVRIYQPSKPATQSGSWGAHHWRVDWDVLGKGHRWENPLMGWQSSGDFMQGTKLEFKSKEDAIAFAEKQGYEYFVQEPTKRAFAPKAYANNFLYSPGKLKHVRTK
ncbi:NADH:ubiquinone oxidoreductase 21kD subunit [Eutypa lata]|uniref:NADH dehydrogenase [ubiquinone] iron-sulfur protein 4, mitochondrial n=1 Tax=Eutypa lata (strain UCR-EL1) TaxID=1287681 RepID=M7SHH9_EUTLA|nr:putative nadh-ubiquinone oxidoreductase 21 kda subunit protein [Eutypa lata UCREL1]KAI1252675.1 NADH:ubiquinone oxidoreductase 21kD subunit [Eutypa lata]